MGSEKKIDVELSESLLQSLTIMMGFVPVWAKEIAPDGSAPMFYGTGTKEGDEDVIAIVKEATDAILKWNEAIKKAEELTVFPLSEPDEFQSRVVEALAVIERYGGIEGDHHRAWVIDQVVRKLLGDSDEGYKAWVAEMKDGEDGPETYGWDEGIAP